MPNVRVDGVRSGQPVLDRETGRGGARRDIELGVDGGQVGVDGAAGNRELVGNLGVGHALQTRLETVDEMISRLDKEGDAYLKRDRPRLDAYLDTEDFAERLRDDTGT